MSPAETVRGRAVVVQPEQSASYWQPVPANGHADPTLTPATTGLDTLSMGYQTIAPGGRVREHSHGDQVELQICFRGRGRVMVDGVSHALVPGTACLLGYDVKHEIINDGPDDLVMLWVITPPGLEDFFKAIGRPRRPGEPAPAPFARPSDVVSIERALGMNDTRASGLLGRSSIALVFLVLSACPALAQTGSTPPTLPGGLPTLTAPSTVAPSPPLIPGTRPGSVLTPPPAAEPPSPIPQTGPPRSSPPAGQPITPSTVDPRTGLPR